LALPFVTDRPAASRVVAVAYAGLRAQREPISPLRAAQRKAKSPGDQAEVMTLEARGRALPATLHRYW